MNKNRKILGYPTKWSNRVGKRSKRCLEKYALLIVLFLYGMFIWHEVGDLEDYNDYIAAGFKSVIFKILLKFFFKKHYLFSFCTAPNPDKSTKMNLIRSNEIYLDSLEEIDDEAEKTNNDQNSWFNKENNDNVDGDKTMLENDKWVNPRVCTKIGSKEQQKDF